MMGKVLDNLPKYSLWLALALLGWLAIAVFGPKLGVIGWQTGFGFMTVTAGPILMAVVALVALVALAATLLRRPRRPWWKAAVALAIPAILFTALLQMRARSQEVPPIHDVSTDLRNPPQYSAATLALRREAGANPLVDYGTPLGEMEMWQGVDRDLAIRNHADIIAGEYGDLQPIPVGRATREEAMNAVVAAMGEIGLQDVRTDSAAGLVEGTAETFAYGFRDDVVARITDTRIDLRSASRVGVSDLGYNAERLRDLSDAIEDRLGR
ncbi:DUF1499 domain-containing protein [Qipengyuania sp. MTN3-11]|uniref:DUF1499 domain-containing protein n=1 Tax=Qipengyuania sp. MTN3-11 TaxID=3056557 RepID=UPI0036F2ACDD